MLATVSRRPAPLSIAQFLAFTDTRSEEERWELIDGVAHMMAPPTIRHQLIVSALERAINDVLAARRPEWLAVREVGIELPGFPDYRPQADVVVVDAAIDTAARHACRFYLAAEVLSAGDRAIDTKRAFYQGHPSALFVVLVRQDEIGATIFARRDATTWSETPLNRGNENVVLDGLGCVCRLFDLYKGTGISG